MDKKWPKNGHFGQNGQKWPKMAIFEKREKTWFLSTFLTPLKIININLSPAPQGDSHKSVVKKGLKNDPKKWPPSNPRSKAPNGK